MKTFTFSEAGGDHAANEDAFRVEPHPLAADVLLVALADGQGGRSGGARAAQLAVDVAIEVAGRRKPEELLGNPAGWCELLAEVDRFVAADPAAGFTTLVAFAVLADRIVAGASCGDSALLMHDAKGPEVWTEHQFKNPPVGSGDAPFVPFAGSPVPPWSLVAMTDGVWKYAGWDAVKAAARDLRGDELAAALAARARLPRTGRFPDDFTVVAVCSES